MYRVPEEYYIRLHHVRPRFKGDIENVLIYMATEISRIPRLPADDFKIRLNNSIRTYPGNLHVSDKTINNWRTEISSLFGFIEAEGEFSKCGRRALELAAREDLVESFKMFLFNFQYPGAHIKPHAILELIKHGVHFKPAQYILTLLQFASEKEGKRIGISKAEICHCIFNDLRIVRDNEDVSTVWDRISNNRKNKTEYDQTGDIVRYAGDIVDYMEIANLLISYDRKSYYINTLENEAIQRFINSSEWFSGYDQMINQQYGSLKAINNCYENWFQYVNRPLDDTDFTTDILSFIAEDTAEYDQLLHSTLTLFDDKIENSSALTAKDIGDIGESIVHGHECERMRIGGREDLIHLIKRIPTQFALGYDISSVELDDRKRFIEVKTTISSKPLHFSKIHLTRNEWNAADSVKDRYYIYRLMLSKAERRLYLIQDPVGLYKNDIIRMVPNEGADISFNVETAGKFEELLSWNG